jgi:hypothetical protein
MGDRLRILIVALALAALTAPSYAQMSQTTARSDAQKKSDADADRAYRQMIKNVPDKPRNTDPWQDVRGADASADTSAAAGKHTANSNATGKTSAGTKHASGTKPK